MFPRVATLVVIEYGARFPKWLNPSESGHLAVVAQHYEGRPSSLVEQVASRVMRLENRGWLLGSIVFVSNQRLDRDACAARSVLVRGLVARLKLAGGGDLMVSADEAAPPRTRQQLINLVAALESEARRSGVCVALRLAEDPPLLSSLRPPRVA